MAERGKKTKKRYDSDTEILRDLLEKVEHLHVCQHRSETKLSNQIAELDKKIDLHTQKTEYELKSIKELDDRQNQILEEHHQRSSELKRDNDQREAMLKKEIASVENRVQALEQPRKWWSATKKFLLNAGKVAAASTAIWAAYEIVLKLLAR